MLQCGGLNVIFQVLCQESDATSLEEKSEAAGLLAQITSPWLDPPEASVSTSAEGDAVNLNSQWPTLNLTPYVSAFIAALTGELNEAHHLCIIQQWSSTALPSHSFI